MYSLTYLSAISSFASFTYVIVNVFVSSTSATPSLSASTLYVTSTLTSSSPIVPVTAVVVVTYPSTFGDSTLYASPFLYVSVYLVAISSFASFTYVIVNVFSSSSSGFPSLSESTL